MRVIWFQRYFNFVIVNCTLGDRTGIVVHADHLYVQWSTDLEDDLESLVHQISVLVESGTATVMIPMLLLATDQGLILQHRMEDIMDHPDLSGELTTAASKASGSGWSYFWSRGRFNKIPPLVESIPTEVFTCYHSNPGCQLRMTRFPIKMHSPSTLSTNKNSSVSSWMSSLSLIVRRNGKNPHSCLTYNLSNNSFSKYWILTCWSKRNAGGLNNHNMTT